MSKKGLLRPHPIVTPDLIESIALWFYKRGETPEPGAHRGSHEDDSTDPLKRVGAVCIASQFASGSSTGGIQEAINDLPS